MGLVKKKIRTDDLEVGDTVMWYGYPVKVIRLENILGRDEVHVFVDWVPTGWQDSTNSSFPKKFLFTKMINPRPSDHLPCRDSDCDCIFDGVQDEELR